MVKWDRSSQATPLPRPRSHVPASPRPSLTRSRTEHRGQQPLPDRCSVQPSWTAAEVVGSKRPRPWCGGAETAGPGEPLPTCTGRLRAAGLEAESLVGEQPLTRSPGPGWGAGQTRARTGSRACGWPGARLPGEGRQQSALTQGHPRWAALGDNVGQAPSSARCPACL